MNARAPLLLLLVVGFGCAGADPSAEPLAEASLAVNACDETVPAERFIDGLPAYAQCSTVSSGNIWSNNGVDTSTSSLGDDWIQTQRGGGYQRTEWAYRYMHFRWGVDYRHGDAQEWCDGELPSTLVKSTTPVHGDLIVFQGGTCGADESTGHIAVVDTVDAASAKVTFVEENKAGRRSANQACGSCFLHAVANDGSAAGAPGTAGRGGGGAESGGQTGGGGRAEATAGTAPTAGGRTGAAGSAGAPNPVNAGAGGTVGVGGTAAASGGAATMTAGAGGAPAGQGSTLPGTSGSAGSTNGVAGAASEPAAGRASTSGAAGQTGLGVSPLDEMAAADEAGCGVAPKTRGTPFGALALVFVLLVRWLRDPKASRRAARHG